MRRVHACAPLQTGETQREGLRPQRRVYGITASGREEQNSGERGGGQHETRRRGDIAIRAVLEPRAMQTALGSRGPARLGVAVVFDDPRHDGLIVTARCENGGTFNDPSPGGVRPGEPLDHRANFIVIHSLDGTPPWRQGERLGRASWGNGSPARARPTKGRLSGTTPGRRRVADQSPVMGGPARPAYGGGGVSLPGAVTGWHGDDPPQSRRAIGIRVARASADDRCTSPSGPDGCGWRNGYAGRLINGNPSRIRTSTTSRGGHSDEAPQAHG